MSLIQGHLLHRCYLKQQLVNPPGGDESSQNQLNPELWA